MKLHTAAIVAGAVFASVSGLDWAQIDAPPQPGPAAVQPPPPLNANPANPLPQGPAILPGTARPVLPTYPQLQIRFGTIPPISASASQSQRSAAIAARNRIEDASARCEAQADAKARAACRMRSVNAERDQGASAAR